MIPWIGTCEMCQCDMCISRRSRKLYRLMDYGEDDYLLFPPRVLGFSLSVKIWAQFGVESLQEATWDENIFGHYLVLPNNHKKMIWAFIKSHSSSRDQDIHGLNRDSFDFVAAKGEGLVIMLHGTPS
jgi:hypothetical protein